MVVCSAILSETERLGAPLPLGRDERDKRHFGESDQHHVKAVFSPSISPSIVV